MLSTRPMYIRHATPCSMCMWGRCDARAATRVRCARTHPPEGARLCPRTPRTATGGSRGWWRVAGASRPRGQPGAPAHMTSRPASVARVWLSAGHRCGFCDRVELGKGDWTAGGVAGGGGGMRVADASTRIAYQARSCIGLPPTGRRADGTRAEPHAPSTEAPGELPHDPHRLLTGRRLDVVQGQGSECIPMVGVRVWCAVRERVCVWGGCMRYAAVVLTRRIIIWSAQTADWT